MTMADFIKRDLETLLGDWERFAATLEPAAHGMDSHALRNFAEEMLRAVADDMGSDQSRSQQHCKSRGERSNAGLDLTATARHHAADRAADSFTQAQLIAEFRALRGSVTRRWTDQLESVGPAELEQLTRFNEAMDQLLTDSVARFDDQAHKAQHRLDQTRKREEQLLRLNREKDHFLSMLAHELRNPLAPIMHAAELLRIDSAGLGERGQHAVAVVSRQSHHLARLMDDLLDTARINSGRIDLRRQAVDLVELVRECAAAFRPQMQASGLEFAVSLPDQPLTANVDRDRILQVLNNLLDNARKFTDTLAGGGTVEVTLSREGDEAVMRVSDTGVGIVPEHLPRLFELFEQGEVTLDRSSGGLGLGLHLVKRLVHLHSGSVTAHSEGQGLGSEFEVRLPLTLPADQPTSGNDVSATAHSKRVLVVEDNADAAATLQMVLTTLGHRARTAADGSDGLAAAEEFAPDVVLLDLGLPGMDGFEVAGRLRERFKDAVRLVAVTGYGEDAYRHASMKAGFDAHLVKPVSLEALERVLVDRA